MILDVSASIALGCGGLAGGGLMIAALGGAPLLLRLPPEQYVVVHKFLVSRFDPFMPISLLSAVGADAVSTVFAPNWQHAWLAAVGGILFCAVVAVSVFKNVPINRWVATLDPSDPPDLSRHDPRKQWSDWNLVRTTLALIGLLVNGVLVAMPR